MFERKPRSLYPREFCLDQDLTFIPKVGTTARQTLHDPPALSFDQLRLSPLVLMAVSILAASLAGSKSRAGTTVGYLGSSSYRGDTNMKRLGCARTLWGSRGTVGALDTCGHLPHPSIGQRQLTQKLGHQRHDEFTCRDADVRLESAELLLTEQNRWLSGARIQSQPRFLNADSGSFKYCDFSVLFYTDCS